MSEDRRGTERLTGRTYRRRRGGAQLTAKRRDGTGGPQAGAVLLSRFATFRRRGMQGRRNGAGDTGA